MKPCVELASVLWILVTVCACDELGNPVRSQTLSSRWADGDIALNTDSRSFSSGEAERILPQLSGQLHHVDRDPDTIVTLVEVGRTQSQRPLPRMVPLVTEFELPGGNRVLRRWSAPAEASRWRAAFYLDSTPRSATTALVW